MSYWHVKIIFSVKGGFKPLNVFYSKILKIFLVRSYLFILY